MARPYRAARVRANKRWRKKNPEKMAIYRARENAKRRKRVPKIKEELSFLYQAPHTTTTDNTK